MPSPSRLLSIVAVFALATGCRKGPSAAQVTVSSTRAPVAVPSSGAPPTELAAKPTPPAPPARKPTPLDPAGLRIAKMYLAELSLGRKATLAQDYTQAAAHFSKALEALPGDPRALAERGYAHLRASHLTEAEADLAAAMQAAPSSAVLAQILHNRMLVARQSGDEDAALAWEAKKKKLKAARRLPSGVTCTSDVSDSDLEPQITSSLDDALSQLLAAHAREDAVEPTSVTLSPGPFGEQNEADQLKLLAARGPLPDGGWQVWSSSHALRNHALIAHGGKLYGFPNQSAGGPSLCGVDQAAEVTVGGGGARPWYIQRSYRQLVRSYTMPDADGQSMGFCAWTSSKIEVTILDSKTFAGIRNLSVSAQPSEDADAGNEPEHLLELEWQADQVIVDACGQHSVVSYAATAD